LKPLKYKFSTPPHAQTPAPIPAFQFVLDKEKKNFAVLCAPPQIQNPEKGKIYGQLSIGRTCGPKNRVGNPSDFANRIQSNDLPRQAMNPLERQEIRKSSRTPNLQTI
jgi:hypothetical protein